MNKKFPFAKTVLFAGVLVLSGASHFANAQETPAQTDNPAVSAALAVLPNQSQDSFPSKNVIWAAHRGHFPTDLKSAGLSLEFIDSPIMTKYIEAQLKNAGFNVQPADQATYLIKINGRFKSDDKIQIDPVSVGKVLDTGLSKTKSSDVDWSKIASDTAISAGVANQFVGAGLLNSIEARGSIIEALFVATGLHDKFNEALVGDRRGVCLGTCTYWNWSRQIAEMSLGVVRRDKTKLPTPAVIFIRNGIYAKKLYPSELIQANLEQLLKAIGYGGNAPNFKNPSDVGDDISLSIESVLGKHPVKDNQ